MQLANALQEVLLGLGALGGNGEDDRAGVAHQIGSLARSLGVAPDRLTEVISRGSGNSFALNVIGDEGTLDRLAGLAGTLLRKDVRLIVDLAEQADTHPGAVLEAADAALILMDHPR